MFRSCAGWPSNGTEWNGCGGRTASYPFKSSAAMQSSAGQTDMALTNFRFLMLSKQTWRAMQWRPTLLNTEENRWKSVKSVQDHQTRLVQTASVFPESHASYHRNMFCGATKYFKGRVRDVIYSNYFYLKHIELIKCKYLEENVFLLVFGQKTVLFTCPYGIPYALLIYV